MAIAKRFSYSLLISTLAFAGFAILAFSGVFPWMEAQFYSPKIVAEFQGRLDQAQLAIDAWKKNSLDRLDKALSDRSFDGVFSPTASRESLQKRYEMAKLFLIGFRGASSLRILNGDRSQIHFSTEDSDVKVRADTALTYHLVSELSGWPDLRSANLDDGKAHVLPGTDGTSVWFLRPWKDSQGLLPGFAVLSVSLEDLRLALVEGGLAIAEEPISTVAGDDLLFSVVGRKTDASVLARVQSLNSQGILPPVQRLARAGQMTLVLIHRGHANLLAPAAALELDPGLKSLLLISFYTVIFLVTFLIANLRGEPLSVVTRKVKRFQLQVVRQYLDLKESDKIQSLRDELARHSDEIRGDIRKSLGPVRRKDREWVDRYIDTSWQEVMDLLRGPSPPTEPSSNADWKRLETLLQQALTQGRFVVSGAVPTRESSPPPGPRPSPGRPAEEVEDAESLEDLDVEELDSEDVPEAEAVEDLDEAEVEDLQEAEAVDEVEELDEEPEGEVEELDEVEEAQDLEALESVDDAEEAEPLDEVEELDEADDLPGAAEAIPVDTPRAAVFRMPARVPAASPVTTLVADDDADEVEELDDVEELVEELEGDSATDVSYSLERLDQAWSSGTSEVFQEDEEVVTLTDEVFAGAMADESEFGHLVDDVLAGPDGAGFQTMDEEGLVPTHVVREWRWTGAGFDWDKFATGNDEVKLFRALSDIVSELDAFTASILTERDGRWVGQSSVGFSDSGKEALDFGPESALVKGFLGIRALHVLNGGSSHAALQDAFHEKDLKFLKSVICVPLLFRREPAWLLLGLRHEPGDVMKLLAPHRVG